MNTTRNKLFKGLLEFSCSNTIVSRLSNQSKPARNVNIMNESKTTTEYCIESVKKYDYENFMCTLLLKNTARTVALAVRAFNVEVSRVAEQVTQPNIGLMRLKFWEETVDKCFTKDYTKVPQHPVALEIFKALKLRKLNKRYFNNLVKSRADNIHHTSFPTIDSLEKYAESSVSSIYYLLLEGCNVTSVHADHAASHLGKAQGIIQQLRSIPVAKKINFISIPQDILAKHGVSHEDILRRKPSEGLNESAFEVASRAHQHLVKARSLLKDVPKEARAVLLPAVTVDGYLGRLQRVHHDVLHPSLQQRAWIWLPKLWFKSYKGEY